MHRTQVGTTNAVARLLHEDLGEADHLRVILELLSEIDHTVSSILLLAGPGADQEGIKSRDRNRVTLLATTSLELSAR